MQEAARDRAAEQSAAMFRRVEYMNIIGNLGPLMGLLGTVYGMIIAFDDLGASGGDAGTSGELARGISLALVNTMLGLALAIIGLGFFGWCRNRVDTLTLSATVQVLDLLEYFRPSAANLGGYDPVAEEPAAGVASPGRGVN
jgi:biopolymer transport protein ExbB